MKNFSIFTFLLLCSLNNYSTQPLTYTQRPTRDTTYSQNTQSLSHEGFLAETLVGTPYGYRYIKDLEKNDIIIGYDQYGNYQKHAIQSISQTTGDTYIKITIGDETLYAAPHQKFCIANEDLWIEAQHLTPECTLTNNYNEPITINAVETIFSM